MDITPIAASMSVGFSENSLLEHSDAQRPLRIHISAAAKAELSISASSIEANSHAGSADRLAKTIDRIRAEFDILQHRLVEPDFRSSVSGANVRPLANTQAEAQTYAQAQAMIQRSTPISTQPSPAVQLEAVMNQSMRIQTGVFQMAVTFQAGLTASQQAQNGVKTLVEKS